MVILIDGFNGFLGAFKGCWSYNVLISNSKRFINHTSIVILSVANHSAGRIPYDWNGQLDSMARSQTHYSFSQSERQYEASKFKVRLIYVRNLNIKDLTSNDSVQQ